MARGTVVGLTLSKLCMNDNYNDEKYTVPDTTVPLVYCQEVLMFTQQCHQRWDDIELPADTVSSKKKQELANRNLHAQEDFSRRWRV